VQGTNAIVTLRGKLASNADEEEGVAMEKEVYTGNY
jgi:hypothetical protein